MTEPQQSKLVVMISYYIQLFVLNYRSCEGTGGDSSPVGLLLDTMGIESLCTRYNISLRQSLFLASLYLIVIGNLVLLTITLALQEVISSNLTGFVDKVK